MSTYKEILIKEPKLARDIIEVEIEDITEEHEQENLQFDPQDENFTPVQEKVEKSKKNVNITFQEEPEEEEGFKNDDDDEPVETKKQQTPVSAGKPKNEQDPTGRKQRANARIRELNSEKNNLAALLEKERQEKEALRAQLLEGNKSNKETLKTSIANQVQTLTAQIKTAMQNGEAELVVDLQDKLMDAKMQLAGVSAELSRPQPEAPKQEPRSRSTEGQTPQKALDWVEEHPEFKTDPIFYGAAMALNNKLIQEGFDPNSDDFYEEINSRLAPKFPEVFGTDEENDVEYSEAISSSKSPDVKKAPKQTFSGASRTPTSSSSPTQRKSNTVKLTPEEIDQAEQWGLSIEQMARRKLHIQKNKRDDGYVTIAMQTDKFKA